MKPLFASLIAGLLATSALAENPAPDAGRFSMTPAQGGFLRLDKETGAVAFCTVTDSASICRASADERAALETEIARLRRENAELKARGGTAPQGRAGPSDEEMDRALTFTERFMRRMMRILREEAPPSDKS